MTQSSLDLSQVPDYLRVLATSAVDAFAAEIDPTSDPLCLVVATAQWRQAACAAADVGFTSLQFITAADFSSRIRVVAMLADDMRQCVIVAADLPVEGGLAVHLDSLSDVFANAGWHERETAEMFGISFIGNADTRPLLLQAIESDGDGARWPLRRLSALHKRADADWPGAKSADPTDSKPRRIPPSPGVNREW